MAVLLSRQLPNRPNYGTWSENRSVEESAVTDLRTLGAFAALLVLIAAGPVRAAECQGKSGALGTSRILVVDPTEHTRLGMMQYPETLPLADHEVVLTFDDGPRPPYTSRILDILDSECAKATFFIVGQMAKAYPDVVRKIHAAGHTIGTHSYSHPFTFNRMSPQQADAEVEGGITAIADAIGDRNAVAPFFRIPGLLRSETVERYLAGRSLMTWSADFPADDWLHISANEITKRALNRIEARGRGMLLLHDIKPATALALPVILSELKRRGYHIVHVEPATPNRVKTATLASQWLVRSNGRWPRPELSINILLAESVLPAPAPASFGLADSFLPGDAVDLPHMRTYAVLRGQIPLPPESPWPRLSPLHAGGPVEMAQPSDGTSAGPERLTPRRLETAGILRFLIPFSLTGPM
jgi:peptidoglycan/xylan/chitin deacetylase (PgdA/CDA1 family)